MANKLAGLGSEWEKMGIMAFEVGIIWNNKWQRKASDCAERDGH